MCIRDSNAATVRDYHIDDPYRWIHWPTSARRDALYVRQFERDAAGDIWLLLDAQAATQLGAVSYTHLDVYKRQG